MFHYLDNYNFDESSTASSSDDCQKVSIVNPFINKTFKTYLILEYLGGGAFGQVYKVNDQLNDQLYFLNSFKIPNIPNIYLINELFKTNQKTVKSDENLESRGRPGTAKISS